jgi:hypothetical protein
LHVAPWYLLGGEQLHAPVVGAHVPSTHVTPPGSHSVTQPVPGVYQNCSHTAHVAPSKCPLHVHAPLLSTTPLPLHVTASENSQMGPAKPAGHPHEPSPATPSAHTPPLVHWHGWHDVPYRPATQSAQNGCARPDEQAHAPVAGGVHVPQLLHVVEPTQYVHAGYTK